MLGAQTGKPRVRLGHIPIPTAASCDTPIREVDLEQERVAATPRIETEEAAPDCLRLPGLAPLGNYLDPEACGAGLSAEDGDDRLLRPAHEQSVSEGSR